VLEAELHVPLLLRSSRGIKLSGHGERFLQRARLIDAEARRAVDEIAELRGEFEGALTIGASPTPSLTLLPQALVRFRGRYPRVQLRVIGGLYHDHLNSIRAGSMDLALGPIPDRGVDAAFKTEDLFYNSVVIAAREGHPMSDARSLKHLASCEWVVTGPFTEGPGAAIFDAFRAHGLGEPRRVVQCDITWTLQALLLKSDLLCALPRHLLDQKLLRGVLRQINVREKLPHYMISLIHRSDVPLLPSAEYLATLLRRQALRFARGTVV
jgi:DNA-binding transcriptional LysR family regulator